MNLLLDWIKSRGATAMGAREPRAETAPAHVRAMSGTYLLLYKYLKDRFADTVVLTFAEIEDLLGFTLPAEARLEPSWWTAAANGTAALNYSDSWRLANRTAVPNMRAQTVAFERAS